MEGSALAQENESLNSTQETKESSGGCIFIIMNSTYLRVSSPLGFSQFRQHLE